MISVESCLVIWGGLIYIHTSLLPLCLYWHLLALGVNWFLFSVFFLLLIRVVLSSGLIWFDLI